MLSQTLKKIDKVSNKTMFTVAACLVIVCQLVAMALVVNGQVERAESRDSAAGSQRLSVARCNEAGVVAMQQNCLQQAIGGLSAAERADQPNQGPAVTSTGTSARGKPLKGSAPGLVSVTYTAP